ncbi:3-oxoacyl-ACP synthase III family protein [Adlercreutzia sp. ZJ473]|uniref:3-oxoacyl-ACP synthase III family protein n=1 Tax=Adlercreutzia sp. ZJ473 TaxID=2722822 RepID=UPI001556E2F4|nr:ketoacyl-ACP synthase III [Adlercreutzia sp. ZJ473]
MLTTKVEGVRIAGIQCAVPKAVRRTDEWKERFGEKAVEDFKSMVGVQEVHVAAEGQTSSDLAFSAAEKLLSDMGVEREKIGCLVFVTQSPDYRIPATACVLHKRLGLSKDCIALDVNLGCSGYVYGLNVASQLLVGSNADYCLLLVGDTLSKIVSPEDKSACMLFGDSGAATLLVKDGIAAPISACFSTDGDGFKAIIVPSGAYRNRGASPDRDTWPVDGNVRSDYELYMNGTDVFSFTISEVPRQMRRFMKELGAGPDDYDCFAMHQANKFILSQVAKKAKVPADKMPISMDRYGNTSVTSIPLTLCDLKPEGAVPLRVMMCGFGIGLSWGCVDALIDPNALRGIIETDEAFEDGAVSHD